MNPTCEDPFDQLETGVSQSIGLSFLLARTLKNADAHPGAGIGSHEKEGIEVLMIEVGTQLRNAAD